MQERKKTANRKKGPVPAQGSSRAPAGKNAGARPAPPSANKGTGKARQSLGQGPNPGPSGKKPGEGGSPGSTAGVKGRGNPGAGRKGGNRGRGSKGTAPGSKGTAPGNKGTGPGNKGTGPGNDKGSPGLRYPAREKGKARVSPARAQVPGETPGGGEQGRGREKGKARVALVTLGIIIKNTLGLLGRTLFVLFLLAFFTLCGAGLDRVISCISQAPPFDPRGFKQPLTSYIYDAHGREIARVHGGYNRIEVPLQELPVYLPQAFIAIEDDTFFQHTGYSLKDIGRALYNNWQKQDFTDQGASTITQQLIKNAFLTQEKTFERKIQEIWLAIKMEQQYGKEEILEFYLNLIYFDHLNYGVEAASQSYFGKSARDLTLPEAALLAAIPNNPAGFSPRRNFEAAKERQETVLNKMAQHGYLTWLEAREARFETLEIADLPQGEKMHPYFLDYVELEVQNILAGLGSYRDPHLALRQEGLRIYTTLDRDIQEIVERVVDDSRYYPSTTRDSQGKLQPQAAAVLAEPGTGYIRGLAGGRDYGLHNQDLRYLSSRQPGSAIKPVLAFAPALEEGLITPDTLLDDSPATYGDYSPVNYDRAYRGKVTVRQAVTWSYNVPAVQVYDLVTPAVGMAYARRMGITTFTPQDEGILSLVLGGFTHGVRPLDMAQAFAVFANGGLKVPLTTVTRIEDRHGREIYVGQPGPRPVLSRQTADQVTALLQEAARSGTASRLRNTGLPIAGKTGTTSDNRDGWLVSYTPDYVLAAWIGYDRGTAGRINNPPHYPISMSIDIMQRAHRHRQAQAAQVRDGS